MYVYLVLHKSLYSSDWPTYLRLETYESNRNLRSSKGIQLQRSMIANRFQDEAANLFNNLPLSLRNCMDPILFSRRRRNCYKIKPGLAFGTHTLLFILETVFLKFVLVVINFRHFVFGRQIKNQIKKATGKHFTG